MSLAPPSLLLLDHIQEMGNCFLVDTSTKAEKQYSLSLWVRVSFPMRVCVCVFSVSLIFYFFFLFTVSLPSSLSFHSLRLWKLCRTWVCPLHAPLLLSPCVTAKPSLCRPSRYAHTTDSQTHSHILFVVASLYGVGDVSTVLKQLWRSVPSLWTSQEVCQIETQSSAFILSWEGYQSEHIHKRHSKANWVIQTLLYQFINMLYNQNIPVLWQE